MALRADVPQKTYIICNIPRALGDASSYITGAQSSSPFRSRPLHAEMMRFANHHDNDGAWKRSMALVVDRHRAMGNRAADDAGT